MRRREFIGLVGGAAAWPAFAQAQQSKRLPVVGTPPTVAAKAATQTIPIVFNLGTDPVELGLVQSLAHPGGNITGITSLSTRLAEKRLELLHELRPAAKSLGYLVNPTSAVTRLEMNAAQSAARAAGVQLLIVEASNARDFDGAFRTLATADAVLIGNDALFLGSDIVALASRVAVPAIYPFRYSVAAGGLISYGIKLEDIWRDMGEYAGRVLKGERPSDLPVQQSTYFYLVINLRTAKALGLAVPPSLLARADEVIE